MGEQAFMSSIEIGGRSGWQTMMLLISGWEGSEGN
jgi:hypothetical protein